MKNTPLIYSPGTQVVAQKDVMAANDRIAHPAGAVGVIVRSPVDRTHAYRINFSDGFEAPIHHDQLVRLSEFKSQTIRDADASLASSDLYERVIFRCVFGSRAYPLVFATISGAICTDSRRPIRTSICAASICCHSKPSLVSLKAIKRSKRRACMTG